MTDHPSAALTTGTRPHRLPRPTKADRSVVEMIDLLEISSLGTPAARGLRALVDPGEIDRLVERHMPSIPDPPRRTHSPAPPPPTGTTGTTGTEWMARGSCADQTPATFFPSAGVDLEIARRICAGCPVRQQCLEYALTHRIDHGVWGGASERERRRILKRRRLAALTPTVAGPTEP